MKKLVSLLLVLTMVLALAACGGGGGSATQAPATEAPATQAPAPDETDAPAPPASDMVVKVGGKDFTEQLILAQLTVQLLEANGITARDVSNVAGSDTCRKALESGEFSMYWEYTGTAWAMLLQESGDMPADSQALFDAVKTADEANSMIWLDYAPMNNTYALVMPGALSQELGITSYSELGEYITANPGSLVLACDHEFTIRLDGLPGLIDNYGTDFGDSISIMEMGIVYQTLGDGQADVGMVFATDGRIKANNLVLLEDDKHFFPIYNGAPCVRQDVLDAYPQITDILAKLSVLLTDEVMQDLNYKVDGEGYEPNEVAEEFLTAQGLI